MKFSVPTNFSSEFLNTFDKGEIHSFYGKLPADCVGGGRPSFMLPIVNKKRLARHVEDIHRKGLEFNYLLNAATMGNREYTISGQKKIRGLLDWLIKIKVDSVTVAIPYLAQLIKKRYPGLKVCVSSFASVDSALRAGYWEDLGADLIVLSGSLNRDFAALRRIRKCVKCKLELVANNACLYGCPWAPYHEITTSRASQANNGGKGYFISYCVISCRRLRLGDPVSFIRSNWIRPEDVHYYEKEGIDYLKIVDRTRGYDFISNVINAYLKRCYSGNLADLFSFSSSDANLSGIKKYLYYLRYFFKPFSINVSRIHKIFNMPPLKNVHIDNKALEGFIDFFVKGNCKQGLCRECNYCRKTAEKAVHIDEGKTLAAYNDILDEIISERPFKYP